MTDPLRWVDDPSIPDSLRSDLAQAVANAPAPALPPSPPPVPSPPILPWVLGGVVVIAAAGAWWAQTDSGDSPAVPPETEVTAPLQVDEDPIEEVPSWENVVQVAPPQEAQPVATEDVEEAQPNTTREPRRPSPSIEDEIQSMAAIRRAFTTDPARALRLARRAQVTFEEGIFVEERTAMITLSLHRLGRQRAALRSARRFIARFPSSTFRQEIEEILNEREGSPGSEH